MTKKQKYLKLCMKNPVSWLEASAATPTQYMRPVHVALIRVAIRRKRRLGIN